MNDVPSAPTTVFESAVAPWFYLLTIGVPMGMLALILKTAGPATPLAWGVVLVAAVSALAVPVWLLCSTRYELKAGALLIRSGPVRQTIALSDIHAVKPSHSPLAAPALSLNRLEIRYGRGQMTLVSPKDRVGFCRAIGHALVCEEQTQGS